ncbi:MAG: hypothetical protein ACE5D6_03520 [Candidatus Zixiibacteriota bacterium]
MAVRISSGSKGVINYAIIDFYENKFYYQGVQENMRGIFLVNGLVDDNLLDELYFHCLNLFYSDPAYINMDKAGIICAGRNIEIFINDSLVVYRGFYKESHPKYSHIDSIHKIVKKYINKYKKPNQDSLIRYTRF